MSFTSKEVGLDRLSAAGPAAGGHPVLRLPDHGRLRVIMLVARLDRVLPDHQGTHRARAGSCSGLIFLSFPLPVHRDPDRLVHGGGGAPALDGLRGPANGRRDDALPDDPRSDDFARRLLRRLRLHFRLRHLLHLPAAAGRPGSLLIEPPTAAIPNRPMSVVRCSPQAETSSIWRRRIAMVMFWVAILAISISALRAARRVRSRRRHAVRLDTQRGPARAP